MKCYLRFSIRWLLVLTAFVAVVCWAELRVRRVERDAMERAVNSEKRHRLERENHDRLWEQRVQRMEREWQLMQSTTKQESP